MSTNLSGISSRIRRALLIGAAMIPPVSLASAEFIFSRDDVREKMKFLIFLLFSVSTYAIIFVNLLPFIGLADVYDRFQSKRKGVVRTAGIVASGAALTIVVLLSLYFNIAISIDIVRGGPGSSTAPIAYLIYLGWAVVGGALAFALVFVGCYLVFSRRVTIP